MTVLLLAISSTFHIFEKTIKSANLESREEKLYINTNKRINYLFNSSIEGSKFIAHKIAKLIEEKQKNNEIFVTHYVIIGALTDYYPDSAEIVITDQNLNVLSTIKSIF